MRKLFIGLAATTAAVAVSAPASAQFYPAQQRYGYVQPQAGPWLFDYRNQRYARMMQERVQRLRYDIRRMDAQRILSNREARTLDRQAVNVEQRIARYSRYGVSQGEARSIDNQVRRLEERIIRQASDYNRRPGVRRYNPWNYNQYWNYYRR